MEIAFAGAGAVAHRYAAGLSGFDELELVAVADLDGDRAASFAAGVDAQGFDDVATMLRSAEPALVVNLTSHPAHASVSRTCLEAGAHVYSEKPLALTTAEARSLVELAASAGVALGCAPENHLAEGQRLAARRLADGTMGTVQVIDATANVGRVTEWHERPDGFLAAGPLLDGGVYPLTLLLEWFGPVTRVRTADATHPYPAREGVEPDRPTHLVATLEHEQGPVTQLTASFYVPHTAREFYGLEVHGDDASLYLDDAGDLGGDRSPPFSVGRAGRGYTPNPLQHPPAARSPLAGVASLVGAIRRGGQPLDGARRGAHIIAIAEAVEAAATEGGPVAVADCGFVSGGLPRVEQRPAPGPRGSGAITLPPIGFGCARYRDGTYVDRAASIECALDAGYRLLDSAELYGNEGRIGEVLGAPGSPDREALVLVGKVWNTNHGHVREACTGSLEALGVDAFDAYLLHWPDAYAYTGPLRDLADLPPAAQEARTFPRDADGSLIPGDVSLEEAWRGLEAVCEAGLTRTIGLCNVDRETLTEVCRFAEIPPSVVQVERHPYRPQEAVVACCHERGIRVLAHSPLSAPGLLEEPALAEVAARHDASPAQVVLAWNVGAGVVPIPSSVDPAHVVENAAAASYRLSATDRERIADLADPSFER